MTLNITLRRPKHYVDLARQDLAVPGYSKAIELDPENVFYYWERGRAYWVMSRQYQKSLDEWITMIYELIWMFITLNLLI